ncbi:DnaJ-class molecular chaperone [Streptomyces sp. CZ24]|nr:MULTISPECIES: hypothetical protein [Streptomyces]MBT2876423.1 hypothetical protein [Streptomyces sp. McG6]MBT2883055.1 hypothetical protein [Streptomyces sp. McG5]MBT2889236.1 hypothetical protein [Streptomyces sp. McG2]MCX4444630.1 hypothetical protein [Streptomyces albidoflavus]MCX4468453.1 hypothetical protein [Streptomyces albidoflavus]
MTMTLPLSAFPCSSCNGTGGTVVTTRKNGVTTQTAKVCGNCSGRGTR